MVTYSNLHSWASSPIIIVIVHFFVIYTTLDSNTQPLTNATDQFNLLSFKELIIDDPYHSLASWNNSLYFCHWPGVTCNTREGRLRVTALKLNSFGLTGPISSALSNLTFLLTLYLHENGLTGPIPQELGSLPHLQHLNLSFNNLRGRIPGELGLITRLTDLALDSNGLTGNIPPSFANLSSISTLSLSFNNLTGLLPPSVWNLSSLIFLDLQANNFTGTLPLDIGYSLPRLESLYLSNNKLAGPIPRSLGVMQNLSWLVLNNNLLEAGNWAFLTALTNCSHLQMLLLSNNKLNGNLPSTIANLSTKIQWIRLDQNQITGSIPHEINNLFHLYGLFLFSNLLTGSIPPTILKLPSLQVLSLADNCISGRIPSNISSPLRLFSLLSNNITGTIPSYIGNISFLDTLDFRRNQLIGSIPPSLANIPSLRKLHLANNQLSGDFPSQLWNQSSLTDLLVGENAMLTGMMPPDIGQTLPRLIIFDLSHNTFVGYIPDSLSNATTLERLFLAGNSLKGIIPLSLGNLRSLVVLLLGYNQLQAGSTADWGFLDGLANGSSLQRLDLGNNKLGGKLPRSLFNLSNAYQLSVGGNNIFGEIPSEIGNLANITWLDLGGNYLSGSIPDSTGKLKRMQVLFLDRNELSGRIPTSIGNLTLLNRLYLHVNHLTDDIPTSLANCPLELMNLNHNRLTGGIPTKVLTIPTLSIFLGLADNSLTGNLPLEVGELKNLKFLFIYKNKLSGTIPRTLGECQILEFLFLNENQFHGSIPSSLQNLKGIKKLDLSSNNFTGPIPKFLVDFAATTNLNLSFNQLEGEVPKDGIFGNMTAFSVMGNHKLCGGHPDLNLPPCSITASNKHDLTVMLLLINAFLVLILVLVLVVVFYRRRRPTVDLEAVTSNRDRCEEISFSHIDYIETTYEVLLNATDGFSSTNLIGVGEFGTVYKGVMDCDGMKSVAIKVLNLQHSGASRSFMAESSALRSIRHRNLVKILASCSTHDPTGSEFRALVLDYMPNGSLDAWLHPRATASGDVRRLGFVQRLKIAVDVASALDYLHHHTSTTIIHRDLKPSNVLLDDEMTAHLSDFGLARIMVGTTPEMTSTTGLRGSIGYVPPEYGWANRASAQGDVYSYGVLLLEMFTGKAPTDETFKDGHDLSRYVELNYPERVFEITDPWLLSDCDDYNANVTGDNDDEERGRDDRDRDDDDSEGENVDYGDGSEPKKSWSRETLLRDCLSSVFRVGLFCTKEHPSERMEIRDVSREIMSTKVAFLQSLSIN